MQTVTITEKLQQIQKYADDHKACSGALQKMNLVGEHVDVPALARALGVAVEALSFYESRDVYVWPDDWRCRKEGGPPQLEDCEEASEVGENALAEIAKILLPEEKV